MSLHFLQERVSKVSVIKTSIICTYVHTLILAILLYVCVIMHAEAPEPVRRIEVWVDDAHWWLTHDDGQLQLADVCFANFSYNRISFSDDSGEHRLELGTFKVNNLMPNIPSVYQVCNSSRARAEQELKLQQCQ